ncbi:hypothetical protein ACXWR7_13585, partial [Streptococcus pyogenes]
AHFLLALKIPKLAPLSSFPLLLLPLPLSLFLFFLPPPFSLPSSFFLPPLSSPLPFPPSFSSPFLLLFFFLPLLPFPP